VSVTWSLIPSPLGPLVLVARGECMLALTFNPDSSRASNAAGPVVQATHAPSPPAGVARLLERYFAGEVRALDEVEADPAGTAFQRRVWSELRGIPAGTTISYSELALRIGAPAAVRAVGAANGANPIPVVVPCHRVIGADGSLVGYGGGLDRKRWLLAHEGVISGRLW
jgi:methylated-DNA-[protein]-cysteine S-methyltransferase